MSYYLGLKPFLIRVYPENDLFETFKIKLDQLIEDVNKLREVYKKYSPYELYDYEEN